MNLFRNILFVCSEAMTAEGAVALKQALNLAHFCKAALSIQILCPEFKGAMKSYGEQYEKALIDGVGQGIESARKGVGVSEADVPVSVKLVVSNTPAVYIIQKVLQDDHDLVIKSAEHKEDGRGFKALDMALLRKCPCPVWLSRTPSDRLTNIKITVAIDPEIQGKADLDLTLDLLRASEFLGEVYGGSISLVSCWGAEFEGGLREHALLKVSEDEIAQEEEAARQEHKALLDDLIVKAGISNAGNMVVYHIQGHPSTVIPKFVQEEKVDLLVMGTIARTGIAGYFIGNTAEDVFHNLNGSLLALKPSGFVSPIKAY